MEKQVLSFQEEVATTRKQVISTEHGALLIWGWSTFAVAFAVLISVWLTGSRMWEYLWLALPPVIAAITIFRGKPQLTSPTSLYRMMTLISRIMIATVVICAAAAFFVSFNVWFYILMILSLWNGVTAYLLNYPRLRAACFGGLAISFGLLFTPMAYTLPAFMAGIAATMIAPGYIMRSDLENND